MKEEYGDWSLDNNCLEICLSDADIELDQQEQKVESWQILPLTDPPKVYIPCAGAINASYYHYDT